MANMINVNGGCFCEKITLQAHVLEKNIVDIYASILVERDSQKGIIIGAKGSKLKKIGMDSRVDIERMVEMKVNLKTFVKVKSGWSDDERALKSLGYDLM